MEQSKKVLTLDIEVTVSNIQVDGRYYSFDYTIAGDGKAYSGSYESDHVWEEKEWLEVLENGHALKQAFEDGLDRIFGHG